jgi:hypothetical protein
MEAASAQLQGSFLTHFRSCFLAYGAGGCRPCKRCGTCPLYCAAAASTALSARLRGAASGNMVPVQGTSSQPALDSLVVDCAAFSWRKSSSRHLATVDHMVRECGPMHEHHSGPFSESDRVDKMTTKSGAPHTFLMGMSIAYVSYDGMSMNVMAVTFCRVVAY